MVGDILKVLTNILNFIFKVQTSVKITSRYNTMNQTGQYKDKNCQIVNIGINKSSGEYLLP